MKGAPAFSGLAPCHSDKTAVAENFIDGFNFNGFQWTVLAERSKQD